GKLNRRIDTEFGIDHFNVVQCQTIRGGGYPLIPVAFNAEGENGPASEDLAVDAHNCIMVGVLVHRIQGCGTSHARVPPWNCLNRITLRLRLVDPRDPCGTQYRPALPPG